VAACRVQELKASCTRDVAIALIDEVNYEAVLLRDYVMGVGYQ
jgi:hypothetical protein